MVCAAVVALTPGRGNGQAAETIAAAPARVRMVIAPRVFDELGTLADRSKTETVRCLMGGREGDTLMIDVALAPRILESTEGSVRYESCPRSTIALWHNHPAIRGIEPEHSCYLSQVDIHAALGSGAPPVQIVQVRSGVLCWFTPREIRAAEGQSVLLSTPSKRVGRPIDLASVDCSGPARVLPVCGPGEPGRGAPGRGAIVTRVAAFGLSSVELPPRP